MFVVAKHFEEALVHFSALILKNLNVYVLSSIVIVAIKEIM